MKDCTLLPVDVPASFRENVRVEDLSNELERETAKVKSETQSITSEAEELTQALRHVNGLREGETLVCLTFVGDKHWI